MADAVGMKWSFRGMDLDKNSSWIGSRKTGCGQAALIVASVASMVEQFLMRDIGLLKEMGYHVDVAANFIRGSTCSDGKIKELLFLLDSMEVDCYQVDFERNAFSLKADVRSLVQLDRVASGKAETVNRARHHDMVGEYALLHSHSPIGGAAGRLIGKKHHIRTIYTAHGFHFYTGAPVKNWLFFYPIEKWLSRYTDVLITINREDYQRAKKKLHAKKTVYIPGVGVDLEKYKKDARARKRKRSELGLRDSDFMLLSVGELNRNKNHQAVIRTVAGMKNKNLHYFIAGKGELEKELLQLIGCLGVGRQVHLLGYRADVPELMDAADLYVLPSAREGLNVSLMEAMSSGLPCICSDIRGNRDLINSAEQKFYAAEDLAEEISAFISDLRVCKRYGAENQKKARVFDANYIKGKLQKVYYG